jgi:hypothetical protein
MFPPRSRTGSKEKSMMIVSSPAAYSVFMRIEIPVTESNFRHKAPKSIHLATECLFSCQRNPDSHPLESLSTSQRNVYSHRPEYPVEQLNPVLRGWGHHYKRAHVRGLFHQLDGWIARRIWSHRFRRWRSGGWKQLPKSKLYREYGLVNLVRLIPSLVFRKRESS